MGKSIRTETEINEGAVSISYAAVELCKKVFPDLKENSVAIVGSGEMGALAAQHLKQAGVDRFEFINRTVENALSLAQEYQAQVYGLDRLNEDLEKSDIVISATGSPNFVITKEMVKKALVARNYRPMILVDIAAPRDIDPKVNDLPEAYSFCIDDLEGVVNGNRNKRLQATQAAEKIISAKVNEFTHWYQSREAVPVIKELRGQLKSIANAELKKHQHKLDVEQLKVVEEVLHGVMGKWIHHPLEEMKKLSTEGLGREANDMVERLFQLPLGNKD